MTLRRFVLYVALLVLLAVIGLALALWGLFACAPPPLPGDELWTWRQHVGMAVALVLRVGSAACFTADPAGAAMLWIGSKTLGVVLVVLALMVLWESAGRALRRAWFASRGGHVVLAGTAEDLAGLVRAQGRFAGKFYLAPDRAARADLARTHPFAEIAVPVRDALPGLLGRLGAGKARLVAATTRNDLANVSIAETVLAAPGPGEVLLRLEQSAVRALSSHRLRQRAEQQGRSLAVVSLTHLQTRRGMAAAMSGRYGVDGAPRVHIALCGSGEGLQAVALEVARQGFGLEREAPLLDILRTGSADFAAGALERLQATEAAEVRVGTALGGGLDRAIGEVAIDAPPLLAVHCVGAAPGEAEALALRWEEVLLALGLPVPPIVAYASEDRPLGTTGMIRVALAPDLAEARALAHLMDARARAVHAEFLRAQQAARGDAFGSAPAEADWAHLPEGFRDDNRAVADQMDYKLARIFMLSRPGEGGAPLERGEIETLAELAHARWWAAKAMGGWRFGAARDDRAQLHPDMIRYERLSEPVKQKDRDEVASLPAMAKLAGEALKRECRVGVATPLAGEALDGFVAALNATSGDLVPVAVVALDDPAMVSTAEALLDAGLDIEAVLGDGADWVATAPVLRRAWRIHIALGRSASEALRERVTEEVDGKGGIHALA